MTVTFALHHISQRITCRSNGASRQVNNQPGGSDPGVFPGRSSGSHPSRLRGPNTASLTNLR